MSKRRLAAVVSALVLPAISFACDAGRDESNIERKVVIYSAQDSGFAQPILDAFAKQTGISVAPKFDVESTKSVSHVRAIVLEAERPRCDVFWNNEILNTLRLKKQGLLQPLKAANSADYPGQFRDKDDYWCGFAARARILLVNTKVVSKSDMPKSINDMLNPKWKGKIALAKPLFGTTATHAVCLFTVWGEAKGREYYQGLKANGVRIVSGNRQVAQAVGTGEIAFGITDTDDAMEEIAAGSPVAIVYPDRGKDELGTLYLPNVVSIIKGAPHPEEARKLANFLLSKEVEAKLALGPSAQIPLNPQVDVKTKVETPATVHAMAVDFDKAVGLWDSTAAFLAELFGGAD